MGGGGERQQREGGGRNLKQDLGSSLFWKETIINIDSRPRPSFTVCLGLNLKTKFLCYLQCIRCLGVMYWKKIVTPFFVGITGDLRLELVNDFNVPKLENRKLHRIYFFFLP